MQNDENKMVWWYSFVAILCSLCAVLTLVFSVTSVMMARNAGSTAKDAAQSARELAKEVSIIVKSEPIIVQAPDTTAQSDTEPDTPSDTSDNPLSTQTGDEVRESCAYTLREYNGKIGIYSSDGGLLKTLSVTVSSLPDADRAALADGIEVYSYPELTALLEDFS